MRIQLNPERPDPRKMRQGVEALRRGGVIAYPTDTVYGIGCDMLQKKAVEKLHAAAKKPDGHLFSMMCADLSNVARWAVVENHVYRLLKRLIPGPYCFILPATKEVPKLLQTKQKTIGIRVPESLVVQGILNELGSPMLSTSAVVEDGDLREILNDPADIDTHFPSLELILDAGWGGLTPSTVIDMSGEGLVVVREGAGSIEGIL